MGDVKAAQDADNNLVDVGTPSITYTACTQRRSFDRHRNQSTVNGHEPIHLNSLPLEKVGILRFKMWGGVKQVNISFPDSASPTAAKRGSCHSGCGALDRNRAVSTCWYIASWTDGGSGGTSNEEPPVAMTLLKSASL